MALRARSVLRVATESSRFVSDLAPRIRRPRVPLNRFDAPPWAWVPEDAKELYRLTLPPGADARKRGIRVGALKYMNLIEKLVDVLGDNVEQVADRLLRGTSLHPMNNSEDQWSDMDLVQAHLQRIVNAVDRDFDLLNTYRRTAELKCRWIAEGGQLSWPLYDFSDLYSDGQSAEEVEAFRKERTIAADPNQAFYRRQMHFGRRLDGGWWLYGFEQGALQGDEFFYVPHAPLGHVLMWDLPNRREDRFAFELTVQQQLQQRRSASSSLALPIDDWDNARACPTGQTAERTGNAHLQEFFWLLAYPHPDGKRIVPTLYQAGEEGGAYMVPLDMEVMDTLSDAVWVSAEKHCSLFDRLAELLTEVGDDGLNPIERNMRRTAAWLHDNPILKQHREREDRTRRNRPIWRWISAQWLQKTQASNWRATGLAGLTLPFHLRQLGALTA